MKGSLRGQLLFCRLDSQNHMQYRYVVMHDVGSVKHDAGCDTAQTTCFPRIYLRTLHLTLHLTLADFADARISHVQFASKHHQAYIAVTSAMTTDLPFQYVNHFTPSLSPRPSLVFNPFLIGR